MIPLPGAGDIGICRWKGTGPDSVLKRAMVCHCCNRFGAGIENYIMHRRVAGRSGIPALKILAILDGFVKVQYLRYAQFVRISRTTGTLHSSRPGKP